MPALSITPVYTFIRSESCGNVIKLLMHLYSVQRFISQTADDIYKSVCLFVCKCACSVKCLGSQRSSVDRQFVSSMVTGSCSENGHRLDELCGHATSSVKHTFTHKYTKRTPVCRTLARTNIRTSYQTVLYCFFINRDNNVYPLD